MKINRYENFPGFTVKIFHTHDRWQAQLTKIDTVYLRIWKFGDLQKLVAYENL